MASWQISGGVHEWESKLRRHAFLMGRRVWRGMDFSCSFFLVARSEDRARTSHCFWCFVHHMEQVFQHDCIWAYEKASEKAEFCSNIFFAESCVLWVSLFQALSENSNLAFVKPAWIYACDEKQKMIPHQKHVVAPKWTHARKQQIWYCDSSRYSVALNSRFFIRCLPIDRSLRHWPCWHASTTSSLIHWCATPVANIRYAPPPYVQPKGANDLPNYPGLVAPTFHSTFRIGTKCETPRLLRKGESCKCTVSPNSVELCGWINVVLTVNEKPLLSRCIQWAKILHMVLNWENYIHWWPLAGVNVGKWRNSLHWNGTKKKSVNWGKSGCCRPAVVEWNC